jgi:hypothetical protein
MVAGMRILPKQGETKVSTNVHSGSEWPVYVVCEGHRRSDILAGISHRMVTIASEKRDREFMTRVNLLRTKFGVHDTSLETLQQKENHNAS